jgi:DNA processing protein
MNEETIALACLREIGLTPKTLWRLREYFGDLQSIWQASSFAGLSLKNKELLALSERTPKLWEKMKQIVLKNQVHSISVDHASYPILLKEISSPPPFLFLRGELSCLMAKVPVAVVGTRDMSLYGEQVLHRIIPPLVRAGVTIVSGLAYGIDALAHEIALEHGGTCIAVFGSGVDVIYPSKNRSLASRILLNGGVLISEQSLGVRPQASFFPARNRIISGLSKASVVVEAKKKSGSLITARFALDQNRDVYAVPGSIFEEKQAGTNELISQGAYPLTDAEGLLDQLGLAAEEACENPVLLQFDNDEEKKLYEFLKEALDLDALCQKSGLQTSQVNQTLSMMELKGMVRSVQGRRFVRC